MASQAGVDTSVTDMEFDSPCLTPSEEKEDKKDAMNVSAEQEKAEAENVQQKFNSLVAGGDERRDAVRSYQPEVKLDNISVMDLMVKDSSGKECPLHEKKARGHEGCHLGGGSFGEVFKASHKVHKTVAVKLAKSGKEDHIKMYQKESSKHAVARICKYIVGIIGFVQCEDEKCHCGLVGFVMEYMERGSLWDFRINEWKDDPDLSPHTNRMVYEISCGMEFLHSKSIIHRDLKLENVLVDANLHVKIADLGLATNLQTSSGDKCWGTDSHKPPEAFRTDLPNSTKVVTEKYDVYSFAMTLYELLTGIHPYSDRGFEMMKVLKVDAKQPPCLQPVPENTSEDLKTIMIKSWSYEPTDRPVFRDITHRVENLNTSPTHGSLGQYFGEPRSSRKGGENASQVSKPALPSNTDHESVRRGVENLTVQDHGLAIYQRKKNTAETLTLLDHAPSQQSESSAAKPVTETVTQSLIEGHHSHPTGLVQDTVGAQSVGISTGRSPNPATGTVKQGIPESLSQSGSAICGPKKGDIWQVSEPYISQEVASHQESSKSGSYGCLKSQFSGPENRCHDDNIQPPVGAGQSMEFSGLVSAHTEDPSGPNASQPLKSYMEHNNKEPRRRQEPQHGHIPDAPVLTQKGAYSHNFQIPPKSEHQQPHPYGDNKPVHGYGDRRPVPVDISHGKTEYALGNMIGGPIHQESPPVASSQPSSPPSSTERDGTIIFDSSPPSDEDFEIKLQVNVTVPVRASMSSKLDQIISSLARSKCRAYWLSSYSLSTMFLSHEFTLKTLQLPPTVDEDQFTLFLQVSNKSALEKLHSLSRKDLLPSLLFPFFVDRLLEDLCHPVKPDLKVASWEEQFNNGMSHFQKKGKADDSNHSGATFTQTNPDAFSTQANPGTSSTQTNPGASSTQTNPGAFFTQTNPGASSTEANPGASFTQNNCSGATQINTGKVQINMEKGPKTMVIGNQYFTNTHYHGSKWRGAGAGAAGGAGVQKKKQEKIKLSESTEKVGQDTLLKIMELIPGNAVKSLGRHLGLTHVQVDNIVYENRNERSSECAYQVLMEWKQQKGRQATKVVLANALWKANCINAARSVR